MRINSRRKGNRGEREVLNILKSHFGGSWERRSLGIPGPDLLTPAWFDYAVECKNDKAIKAIHTYKPTKLLRDYWDQASAQADALDKVPLLVCKVDGVWLACEEWCFWMTLNEWCLREKVRSKAYREYAC